MINPTVKELGFTVLGVIAVAISIVLIGYILMAGVLQ